MQYRLITTSFSTNEADWQGVDDEPIANSNNLVESGGVYKAIKILDSEIIRKVEPEDDEEEIYIEDNDTRISFKKDSITAKLSGSSIYKAETTTEDLDEEILIQKDSGKKIISISEEQICINNNILFPTVLDGNEICDYFAVNNSGNVTTDNSYGCSSYIECFGNDKITISMIQEENSSNYGLAFYDESKVFIPGSFISNKIGEKGKIMVTVQVPQNAYYFKTTYFNYNDSVTYGKFECILFTGNKRPNIGEPKYFSVEVNQAINAFWDTSDDTAIANNYKKTTGVLWLPSTYTQDGAPVPIIIYFHGASHYVYY